MRARPPTTEFLFSRGKQAKKNTLNPRNTARGPPRKAKNQKNREQYMQQKKRENGKKQEENTQNPENQDRCWPLFSPQKNTPYPEESTTKMLGGSFGHCFGKKTVLLGRAE